MFVCYFNVKKKKFLFFKDSFISTYFWTKTQTFSKSSLQCFPDLPPVLGTLPSSASLYDCYPPLGPIQWAQVRYISPQLHTHTHPYTHHPHPPIQHSIYAYAVIHNASTNTCSLSWKYWESNIFEKDKEIDTFVAQSICF